ncbi:MAG TPA: hypothetical protein VFS92_06100, partial [Planctomycetota bacterium]|nr:hypothetical protein [Planctomycetota bacterium]
MHRPIGSASSALLGLAVLLAASAAPAAPAGETDARAEVADLIALASGGVSDSHDGPSPTTLARRILERKEKEVRAILEDAWKRAGTPGTVASAQQNGIHHVARYLWSVDPPAQAAPDKISFGGVHGAIHEIGGIVLVRPGGTGERGKVMGERGWDRDDEPRTAFAALVKGGKWRKPPRFDPKAAFKALDGDAASKWNESEAASFHIGLGEACGADAGSRPLLLKRFEDAPGDARLAAAVGRIGTPEAAAVLRGRIGPLARRVGEGKDAALPLLTAVCKGVARSDPAAFLEEAAKLGGAGERACLRAVGFRLACTALLDRHARAPDAAGKRQAVLDTVTLVLQAYFFREFPTAADMPRLVRAWTESLDSGDAELAEWVDRGAYGLFHVGFRDGGAN